MADSQPAETKEDYIINRFASNFNLKLKQSLDKFKKSIEANETSNEALKQFAGEKDPPTHLICQLQGENGTLTSEPPNPNMFRKKAIICLRLVSDALDVTNIHRQLIFIEMTRPVLDHLYNHFQEVYMPILHNPANQADWSELVSRDLMDKFNNYLAQVYVTMGIMNGKTSLPLPPYKFTVSESTQDKEKAHIFEGSIITWTRQIKNVLKTEPEQVLKLMTDPDPLQEIKFWKKKSENLDSIHKQLQSDRVKKILKFLEQNKSTYNIPFSKLQKEVQGAREEAGDNYRFLKTLEPYFDNLVDTNKDFSNLHELFLPIMHTILLIWKHSKFYNTPPRLVVLIREICNAIIKQACNFISGAAIFQMINDNEESECCKKLQLAIDVATKFKDTYFEYKAKANGGWKLTTNALFVRLDSFLERCHDILHLTQTIVQFNTLEKIEIGGTKGKSLTESVVKISQEFKEAVQTFQAVAYDIMDISAKAFDDDFYAFRSKIKELERRLASVITQGFDDSDTIHGRFKLLDSFEGLLSRPIIQDELEKKHIILIDSYKQDLKNVQSIFLEGKVLADHRDERAPIYKNLPPIAGSLTWCRSLLDRIKEPMDKLQNLSQAIIDREEFKDVQKLYQSIVKSIKEYEDSKILQWQKESDESSREKLKEFLLIRNEDDLLKVNFDAALIRLLRETRYFTLLDQSIPQSAASVYSKDDTYRKWVVALDGIVFKYNNIKTCLIPVEEPLVIDRIKKMDELLKPGIEKLTWKNPDDEIDKFINAAKTLIESIDSIVQKMKGDLEKMKGHLAKFDVPLIQRPNKVISADEFMNTHSAAIIGKQTFIKTEAGQIQKLIKEILDQLQTDRKSAIWRNYIEYINNEIVLQGVIKAISTCCNYLNDQINFERIKNSNVQPMFDIKIVLDKHENKIRYEPEIEGENKSLMNNINSWIKDFLSISTLVNRVDGQTGDFLTEVRDAFEVKESISKVYESADWIVLETNKYRETFSKFSYLWESDPKAIFQTFLEEEVAKEIEDWNKAQAQMQQSEAQGTQAKKPNQKDNATGKGNDKKEEKEEFVFFDENLILLKGVAANLPKIVLFDDRISKLRAIQNEIQTLKSEIIIGWLKVSVTPLKGDLDVKVSMATKVYTEFLLNQVRTTLGNLKSFIDGTNKGIQRNPNDEPENSALLMNVMKIIAEVRNVEGKTEKIIDRLRFMVAVLKKYGVHVEGEDFSTTIDVTYSKYRDTKKKVDDMKASILHLQAKESESLKKRLEQFSNQVRNFKKEFMDNLPFGYDENMEITDINKCYDMISEYYLKLIKIENEAKEYANLENLFGRDPIKYPELNECRADLKSLKIMWDAIAMVTYQYDDWKSKTWKSIKADLLIEANNILANQIKIGSLREIARVFPKGALNILADKVKNMKVLLPLIQNLHSEFMEDRHWKEVMNITGKTFDHNSPTFNFKDVLLLKLYTFEAQINELVEKAQKEAKIEKKLNTIESTWIKQIFPFEDDKDFKEYEIKLLGNLDAIVEQLDGNTMDLMSMASQKKYVEFFNDRVQKWKSSLSIIADVIEIWLKVQKNWKRLVNIFSKSDDIRSQLPDATKDFESLDKDFREIMNDSSQSPGVIDVCTEDKKENLLRINQSLEKCEKALNDYLEDKKKAFPRFYFVSNQALLDILSNGNNPQKVAKYLGDCFDGLKTLKFIEDPTAPGGNYRGTDTMISKEGETVPFATPFVCEGAVENYLSNLEFKMRETLHEILEVAKEKTELWEGGERPREEWLMDYCAQLALVATQIVWTEEVQKAFEDLENGAENAMKDYFLQVENRIKKLIDKVRTDLTPLDRVKVITIITIDVHSRDVVEKFARIKLQDKEAFAWQSQLKFFWEKARDTEMAARQNLRFPWEKDNKRNKCIIRIVDWCRFYSYEYVGNCGRLVITPLTDRCYITLTQALNLTMGGAPAGPAGTGKTETTKDLGRAIGLPVMVFNCSDQMNYESMAQIFMGLAQSGAWGCFDEFNRISIEVLSVVSTQVKQVLDALKRRDAKFLFMDKDDIRLIDTVGFFITMNPGYAGRTELPENLKALFRSCAMVVPDLVLICENMLMSEGFADAKKLSNKFVTLYMLSRSLLSKQIHYDWGLRAVKSVLRQAGKLKRGYPDDSEDVLLKRALRDFNMPKIILDDKQIFLDLLEDLFPKINAEEKFDTKLFDLVKAATREKGYFPDGLFPLKCVQLSEIMEVRHCVFIIGPPGSAKTTIWKTLAVAYKNRGQDTMFDTINPKAVTADELFGYMTKSKEWKDGVLSNIMRNQAQEKDKYKAIHKWKWVILDGDVDPEWIESLNTVMDDNKLLTLVSNERIPLTPSMRLLFEVSNLKNATPATVSRGGVLYVNESDVGWRPYMDAWIERSVWKKMDPRWQEANPVPEIDDVAKSIFNKCFDTYFEKTEEFHTRFKHIVPFNDMIIIMSVCSILDALLNEHGPVLKTIKDEEQKKAIYEGFFLFAGMWAVGGSVGGTQDEESEMKNFSSFWRTNAKIKYPEQGGLCLDYFYDLNKGWTLWKPELYKAPEPGDEVIFSKIYVPTIHTTKLQYILTQHVASRKPVLFIGSAGTGKTALVRQFLTTGISPERNLHASYNMNSSTRSYDIQKNIESRLEKKTGKTYGIASNKTLIYFVDDLNMPYVDKYGTQTPIALVRQIIDYGSVYNRDQLDEKKFLEDLLFFAALNPKSGSFIVDLRLQRHFTPLSMPSLTKDLFVIVYGQILAAHFSQFEPLFHKLPEKFVEATSQIFNKIIKDPNFSPSAKKFHYQFNLRELSKVMEGIMNSTPKDYKGNASKVIRLWAHECKRVFEDRLINNEDIAKFREYLALGHKVLQEDDKDNQAFLEPNIYTFFVSVHNTGERSYLPVESMGALKKVLEDKLVEHNETLAKMDLVLFDQAMEHISRICRILDQISGHAMLVGVGGSGKQSLAKLAAFITGVVVKPITVTQSFGVNELKAWIQELVRMCAKTPGTPHAFMITDSQIQDEAYLISINDILSSGYIPDLFPKDELEALTSSLRNEARGAGYPDNNEGYMNYFVFKLKKNLHMILCFSPVGDKFRIRARKFPGLINCTMIDWFHGWPHEALIDVARRFLSTVELPDEELREAVAQNMAAVHTSINDANQRYLKLERRYNYTTPKSYLELIDFYKILLNKKRDYITTRIVRLENGLETLAKTSSKVKGLQDDLKIKMVEVEDKRQKTDVLIDEVTRESDKAAVEQAIANEEEAKCNLLSQEANEKANVAQKALDEALPALIAAQEAVKMIDKNSITEMKSLPNPPPLVMVVAKAILILLLNEKIPANEDTAKTWKRAVQIMGDPAKFKDKLLNYKSESIEEFKLEAVKVILDNPENLKFDFQELKKKSLAAAYLGKWLTSSVDYNRIFKIVAPLQESTRIAKETLEAKSKELAIVKEKVRVLNEKVDALRRKLDEAMTEKAAVEAEAKRCQEKLQAAENLVKGLAGENVRWSQNLRELKQNTLLVIGDALLASAFVSYIGAFSASFRKDLWKNRWIPDIVGRKIHMSEGIEPLKILTDDSSIARWKNEGLPADQMSLENASIITSCSRWPLIIDPQLQGSNWIRGRTGSELQVLSLTQDKWMYKLQQAVQQGKIVIIENLGQEIDATLDPLLSRAILTKGNSKSIKLGGDNPIDYDDNFKLYLQTKLSNPHFRPEVAAQCTIINFIVTEYGLEEQLLAMVVKVEKPELEDEKSELVRRQNEFQVQLDQLESNLLNLLAEADPDTILDNKPLIESLDNTKKTAVQIAIEREKAKETELIINQQREFYRKVAAEGATLYFLIISLCFIEHMYQYSLEAFQTFFFKAIEKTQTKDETRVDELVRNIRFAIYQWVSRGLFERHKLIFLSLITFRLMQKKVIGTDVVQWEPIELQFLLQATPKVGIDNPLEAWLPLEAWGRVQRLIDLDEFKNFGQNMEKDAPTRFKDWYNELEPENAKLPLDWKRLDGNFFKKLLVLRCLRPDRITFAMKEIFIRNTLPEGDKFVEMDSKNSFGEILQSAYDDSTPNTPIFFILSPGSDPVREVEKLAKKLGFEVGKTFFYVALGQGQDVVATEKLERGHKEGHWVMLQNIHLMPRWLIDLEKKLDQFAQDAGGTNPAFRLFLSAEPSTDIPIGILERCIKLTNEPPAGLKANMKRAWQSFNKEEIEEKDGRIKVILFGLCFFHSTVLERRKFGALGWNMSYPFNMGDLRDSANVLIKYFETGISKVPWDDLAYIFGEIMYGGHIVDDWDRRLCKSYLENLMVQELFDEKDLFPFCEGKNIGFKCPPLSPFEKYLEALEFVPNETPLAYGLHPNAEIGFRTNQCNVLFSTLLELQPKDTSAAGEGEASSGAIKTKQDIVVELIQKCNEDYNFKDRRFDIDEIKTRLSGQIGPYQNVFLQECEYMNALFGEMIRSLDECDQGMKGLLTISEAMEKLMDAIALDRVPENWTKLAYSSKRGLASWLDNLLKRHDQISKWKDEPHQAPKVTYVGRLFNPSSFLTAIKQVIGRPLNWELNNINIMTEITKKTVEEVDSYSKDGAYIFGMVLEGARWDTVGNSLEESRPKEMFYLMPVIYCRAVQQIGDKEEKGYYYCPCYVTEDRGKTYVFTAQLKTKQHPRKWILAGVAMLMDVESVNEDAGKKKEKKEG